jgi:hypothetical protein
MKTKKYYDSNPEAKQKKKAYDTKIPLQRGAIRSIGLSLIR